MKRLVHLVLVIVLVVATTAASGWTGMGAFAQPFAQPVALDDSIRHCDACGDDAVVVMACGTVCGSIVAVMPLPALASSATEAAAWTWANQIATTANIEPEHAPPRG